MSAIVAVKKYVPMSKGDEGIRRMIDFWEFIGIAKAGNVSRIDTVIGSFMKLLA